MADPTLPPGLIEQPQFDQAAAHWLSALTAASSETLRHSLQPTGDKKSRRLLVTFSLEHILLLISTIRASYIEARFLLLPPLEEDERGAEATKHARFTVALFATDAHGTRLSAYYVSNTVRDPRVPALLAAAPLAAAAQVATDSTLAFDPAQQVPFHISQHWLRYWREAADITPALFTTAFGPLEGYRFSLDDFVEPLFRAQPVVNKVAYLYNLHVDFGLHHYYPASLAGWEPTATFGLVLRLQAYPLPANGRGETRASAPAFAVSKDLLGASEPVGEPFFDMSTPCPPGH